MNDLNTTLARLGFSLDEKQPHLGGERRIFAADKSVLFGKRIRDSLAVVIKASCEEHGIKEIVRERECREALDAIRFAYDTFSSPEEILFSEIDGYVIQVTRFIEQDMSFLERPTSEQFRLILKGLKAMESARATTYGHIRSVRGIFPTLHAKDYIATFSRYTEEASTSSKARSALLRDLPAQLSARHDEIERYCGFLTHFDFMPQNIRISDEKIYLLDHSSMRFGNKHESWARIMNFMELYNPELARALETYIHTNRAPEEAESLRLMRLYRLGELLAHHARIEAAATDQDLRELSGQRAIFWSHIAQSVETGAKPSIEVIAAYKAARDTLRSPEEHERQKGLH